MRGLASVAAQGVLLNFPAAALASPRGCAGRPARRSAGQARSARAPRVASSFTDAGQRSAILYAPIVSYQHKGKDPMAYMNDLLTRLPTMSNREDLRVLNPRKGQPAKASFQSHW